MKHVAITTRARENDSISLTDNFIKALGKSTRD